MNPRLHHLLLSAALCSPLAALAAPDAPPVQRSYGSLRFDPCSLSASQLPSAVEAQCTSLDVAENRADAGSRKISLGLGWVPASGEAEPDPIFMIAGGPGQSAKQSYPMVHAAFRDLRRSRHVLLLDARGTGDSHPLACRDSQGKAAVTEGEEFDPAAAADFARRCAETLGKDADLRYYGTAEHIDDIDEVRRALGVDKINLIGISYGTRVAQQYAKRYPQHVRAIVLDSVVPNTLVLGNEHAANLESALDLQFERCRQIPACAEKMGDPREQLKTVRAALAVEGRTAVRYRDALSGEWKEEVPSFGHLGLLLRMYAYSPEAAATLPLLLNDAANGRYEALLAQANSLGSSLSEQIYHGMQLSVMCTEDADEFVAQPGDADSVLGTEFIEFARAQCAVWPKGQRDPAFREPLSGDLPVLLLSGEFDPVTPPRYADEVAKTLPKSRHLVLKGQGHSVVGLGCAPKLFAQFIEKADARKLDAACLDRLRPLPPFAGVYGWEP